MPARKPSPIAAPRPAASASPSGSTLVTGLASTVVVLVAALVIGGWWMQSQRTDAQALRQQADVYERYLYNTDTPLPPSNDSARAAARAQAQATRQYLVEHPAVTPGAAFEKPGVQATGLAIVRAIDGAKGL